VLAVRYKSACSQMSFAMFNSYALGARVRQQSLSHTRNLPTEINHHIKQYNT